MPSARTCGSVLPGPDLVWFREVGGSVVFAGTAWEEGLPARPPPTLLPPSSYPPLASPPACYPGSRRLSTALRSEAVAKPSQGTHPSPTGAEVCRSCP